MTASSVSFRITRHTEDLAQTIHALSQRLVLLEQRLAALEDQLAKPGDALPPEQLTSLENVDQLLRDCRELLASEPAMGGVASLESPPAPRRSGPVTEDPLADMETAA